MLIYGGISLAIGPHSLISRNICDPFERKDMP